jgi:LysR family transcriptional activator of nhaA
VEWLNYHHLLYFWTVAREGTIARASEQLALAPPTISAQIAQLEAALGEKLFARSGRRLVLTDTGRVVYGYADRIFGLGRELMAALRGATERPLTFVVGVAQGVPKLVASRVLEPAFSLRQPVHLVCREDHPDRLLADLAVHGIDAVIADAPPPPGVRVRAFTHLLGECGVAFFAPPALARRLARGFPRSLDQAPMLLPRETSALRLALERWLDDRDLRPRIVGEFDDSALMTAFVHAGAGVFPSPGAIEREVRRQHGVGLVGRAEELRERFYVIALERRLTHPAIVAIRDAARTELFGTVQRA